MDARQLSRISLQVRAGAYQGMADLHGILTFDGESVQLSFQTADAILGLLKSKPTSIRLSLDAIDLIEYHTGWFWLMPYVEMHCHDFASLVNVPSAEGGKLRLRLSFAERAKGRKLVDAVRFARAQALHDALNQGLEPGAAIVNPPPLPTSTITEAELEMEQSAARRPDRENQ